MQLAYLQLALAMTIAGANVAAPFLPVFVFALSRPFLGRPTNARLDSLV